MLSNMLDFGMEPQAALDAPRWSVSGVDSCIGPSCVRTSRYIPPPPGVNMSEQYELRVWWAGLILHALKCEDKPLSPVAPSESVGALSLL